MSRYTETAQRDNKRGAVTARLARPPWVKHCGLILGVLCMAFLATAPARADETASTRQAAAARSSDEPHTMAELGIGFLTLPSADVCVTGACSIGDATIELDLWQMYHATKWLAVGAGATIAVRPTSDDFRGQAGGFDRTHSRSYFLVEAEGRAYVLHLESSRAWLGTTVGGVIVSDRYTMGDSQSSGSTIALIGPKSSTIRTEGLTLGALAGMSWMFSANWSLGGTVRYMRWFLPESPATNVFGDRATLTDEQNVFDVGLVIAYEIAL